MSSDTIHAVIILVLALAYGAGFVRRVWSR
jgi:hypothetical protein